MARDRDPFRGKSAIITGGASGIGLAIGAQLYAAGAHVVLADIDGEAAERAASSVAGGPSSGGSIVGAPLDVRDRDAVRALVESVAAEHGRLDLLFNNAGISLGGPTENMPGEHWDRILDVNIGGVVNGVLAAYPLMVAQGRGHIISTASGAGLVPAVFVAAYTATKHAVVGLSTALRPEAAAHGVRVSVLCPGMIDTPILDKGPPADLAPQSGPTLTGRQYLKVAGLRAISAEKLAEGALRGVARNQAIIVVPRSLKVGWFLARQSPSAVQAMMRMTARRVRKEMARRDAGA